jgi:hypothetical protein
MLELQWRGACVLNAGFTVVWGNEQISSAGFLLAESSGNLRFLLLVPLPVLSIYFDA